jgi:hypothetical protein
MSFEDKETHQMFEMRFKATNAEANAVFLELIESESYAIWDELDSIIKYSRWNVSSADRPIGESLQETARMFTKARKKMIKLTAEVIKRHGLDQ